MALKRKRLTKKTAKQERKIIGNELKTLPCKVCGEDVFNVGVDIKAITCSDCCIKMSAPPDLPPKPKPLEERNPRGWQFMKEYRSPDGVLYHRGVKVDETISTNVPSRSKRSGVRKTAASKKSNGDDGEHSKTTSGKRRGAKRTKSAGSKTTTRKPVRKQAIKKTVKRTTRRPSI